MTSDRCRVIDASQSVIEKREEATDALAVLAEGRIDQLVLWVPAVRPADSDGKQRDPFSVFAEIGAVFPQGDGDDYASLCRRAKPDHVPEINRLFEEGEPSFDMVDALDEGGSWPKLKTLLGANSAKEILLGIMSPKPHQEAALKNDPTWASEAGEFIQRSLGHRLKTKGQTRPSISEELWRVVLFSEFVFDSAGNIPAALETVPRAGMEAKSLIYDVCDELRKHEDHKDPYRLTAKEVEDELALATRSQGMTHLGERDTFSFEERFYLHRLVDRALLGQLDQAKEIGESRKKSIWLSQEDRLAEWSLAARALELLDAAQRLSTPRFLTLESIVHGYAMTWRDLDRHHREMEQAVNQWQGDHEGLEALVARARSEYFRSVEALQAEFVRLVAAEGWLASGSQLISNCEVFSKVVAPALEAGERVAYFLVDSLRYELGVEVEKQLSDKLKVTLQTVCAQLPTYTEVGMASLMPNAESALKLMPKDGKLVTTLNGNVVTTPASLVMERAELGIPGDFKNFGAPRKLVPYSRGQTYYHEGLSLQECVLPCLTVRLETAEKKKTKSAPACLTLTYRQGKSDRITSRRPVVDLTWPQADLFTEEGEIEVVLEASDSKGNIVGWVGSGQSVNPATGGVRIKPGAALAVGLRMEDDFSGNFTVRVLDPSTNLLLANLNLKTGYLE